MTKKSGLFDVDFTLTTKELTASIKEEKTVTARYKPFSEALGTIVNQMEVSGYRPRTIKDYNTVLMNFSKSTGVTYLEEIAVDMIYSWLDSIQVTAILPMYKTIHINTLEQLNERHIEEAYLFHKKVKIQQSLFTTFSPN